MPARRAPWRAARASVQIIRLAPLLPRNQRRLVLANHPLELCIIHPRAGWILSLYLATHAAVKIFSVPARWSRMLLGFRRRRPRGDRSGLQSGFAAMLGKQCRSTLRTEGKSHVPANNIAKARRLRTLPLRTSHKLQTSQRLFRVREPCTLMLVFSPPTTPSRPCCYACRILCPQARRAPRMQLLPTEAQPHAEKPYPRPRQARAFPYRR